MAGEYGSGAYGQGVYGGVSPVASQGAFALALWDAYTQPSVTWRYGLDILAADEVTPLEDLTLADGFAADRLVEGTGSVTLDVTASAWRSCQLTLRSTDGRYLPGLLGFPSGGVGSPTATGLVWPSVRYRPWMDLSNGVDAHGAPTYLRVYLGIFVLVAPLVDTTPTGTAVQLTLVDKSVLLQKPYTITATTLPTYTSGGTTVGGYAAGTTVDAAMADLATRGGIPASRQNFAPSTMTLPADYPIAEGDDYWSHLQALATALAHVLAFDVAGTLVRKPNPLGTNAPARYRFAPGPLCTIGEVQRQTDFTATANHLIVTGGSSSTALVRGEAQVTDPASPYHKNLIGERVAYWGLNGLGDRTPDPTITTAGQANALAATLLAAHLGQQETALLIGRNLPTLDGYDRLSVAMPGSGLNLDMFVSQVTWYLAGSGMRAGLARWVTVGG